MGPVLVFNRLSRVATKRTCPMRLRSFPALIAPALIPALALALPTMSGGAVPSEARETVTVAVTPDGTKAYVGNNEDGSVSVIDAVNDLKLAELPVTIPTQDLPYRPIDI